MARALQPAPAVRNSLKGVVVGTSNALAIGIAMAISISQGLHTTTILATEQVTAIEGLFSICVFGIPVGAALGALVGSLDDASWLGPHARRAVFAMLAVMCLLVCLPVWPDLATCAMPITIAHALALARWTTPRPTLPPAVVR